MNGKAIILMAGVGILSTLLPLAQADEWNEKTVFTFSGPVEIPGKVLPAGTYVFKLEDSQSDRNVVQVFSKNEQHLYGTFLAIPDFRLKPSGKAILTFEERKAGSPEAVKAWFYPGDSYGHQFVYPKKRALELASANNSAVPSMPDEMAANTTQPAPTMQAPSVTAMKQTPLKAQKPTQEEAEITEVFVPPPPAQNTSAPPESHTLPHTASPLPLIGLFGLFSLGTAVVLRSAANRAD